MSLHHARRAQAALALSVLLCLLAPASAPRAADLLLRWLPPTQEGVAGYRVHLSGPSGPVSIDVGQGEPEPSGTVSHLLTSLDPAVGYDVQVTAYDAAGRESPRSNLVVARAGQEHLETPLWRADWAHYAAGVHPGEFRDTRGDVGAVIDTLFRLAEEDDGGRAYGTSGEQSLVASRLLWSVDPAWQSVEVSGRMIVLSDTMSSGIVARAPLRDLTSYFTLVRAPAGQFSLAQVGKQPLVCARGPWTGVTSGIRRWHWFRFRVTSPSGRPRVRARVWADGAREPTAWQADCWTNGTLAADTGLFGLWRNGRGAVYWADLALHPVRGTPTPISVR